MQLDIAWTDALLAAVAFQAARRFFAQGTSASRTGAAGLLLLALAAALGALRFSIFPGLTPLHALATGATGAIGLPLLGVSYWLASPAQEKLLGRVALLLCLVGLLMLRVRPYWFITSTLAMLLALWSSLQLGRRQAVIGCVLMMLAGLVAGEGRWFGMERNAWFHLVMALGCWYLSASARPRSRADS